MDGSLRGFFSCNLNHMIDAETLIVGAGPAGLATAAALGRVGVTHSIVDAAEDVGSSWRGHYERLRLHTAAEHSALPFRPFPDHYPTYPSRQQIVDYLADYARHFSIRPHFGKRVTRLGRSDDRFSVEFADGTEARPRRVVVATGYNGVPNRPALPGLERFAGTVTHSRDYYSGRDYADRDVLVVGCGNSGGEIAIDLWECGARPALVVRSEVHVQPRDFFGVPSHQSALLLSRLPRPIADAVGRGVGELLYGDLEAYGIHRPAGGPISMLEDEGRVPLIDIGTVELIRQGAIEVVPGVREVSADEVEFVDGTSRPVDDIVLATGYRSGLTEWLDDAELVLDDRGYPTRHAAPTAVEGLYFVGFRNPATGALHDIRREAIRLADTLSEKHRGRN